MIEDRRPARRRPAPSRPAARDPGLPPARCARPDAARRAIRGGLLCLVLPALLAACAPGANLPVLGPTPPGQYALGVDDDVRVIIYGEDQLSHEYRVGDDGNVAVPLLGPVHADGLTTTQLGAAIATQLRDRKLLREPSVSVQVIQYRPIFVLGEVAHPGQFPYQPGMTMLTAATVAGGFTYRAVQSYAYVVRLDGHRTIEGRLLPGGFLQPGDVVKFYERTF